jgi:hypothetical protein
MTNFTNGRGGRKEECTRPIFFTAVLDLLRFKALGVIPNFGKHLKK